MPFGTLILLTALQSLDGEQIEAAEMDGAGAFSRFFYLVLPHMSRAITVVILIQTIFLLSVFAEILVTTDGGPGLQTTNITYLIYAQALCSSTSAALRRWNCRGDPWQHRRFLPHSPHRKNLKR